MIFTIFFVTDFRDEHESLVISLVSLGNIVIDWLLDLNIVRSLGYLLTLTHSDLRLGLALGKL